MSRPEASTLRAKYEIYEIIDKLADAGKAVIVISSELPELIGICDRIYTVSYGVVTDNVGERMDLPRNT